MLFIDNQTANLVLPRHQRITYAERVIVALGLLACITLGWASGHVYKLVKAREEVTVFREVYLRQTEDGVVIGAASSTTGKIQEITIRGAVASRIAAEQFRVGRAIKHADLIPSYDTVESDPLLLRIGQGWLAFIFSVLCISLLVWSMKGRSDRKIVIVRN